MSGCYRVKGDLVNIHFPLVFRQSFPPLSQHLLETKRLDYILTGNIQSDLLEKHFGRYRQLSGANYFGSEKQFLDTQKAIRVF